MSDSGEFTRFVGRVHRRRVAVRLLEQAGIGAAAGAVMAWAKQGDDVFWLIALGAAAGLLVGWWRRPSRMSSAVEADRQLGLKELLSSALSLDDAADPWRRAVLASAENRVRGLSTWGLKFRRVGGAGWCVIGVFVLMSMGIRVMREFWPAARAAAGRGMFLDREELSRPENWLAGGAGLASPGTTAASSERSSMDSPAVHPAEGREEERKLGPGEFAEHSSAGSSDQAGPGSAQTEAREPDKLASPDAGHSQRDQMGGRAVGGTGEPAADAGGGSGRGALAGGSGERTDPAPPWQSDQWAADRQAAMEGVENGQVPGRYQALVRAYFALERR